MAKSTAIDYITSWNMPESTGVDCIDKIVRSIQNSVGMLGIELTRNVKLREEDSNDKRYIGEGILKYICEVFEYQNGRGKKGRLGVGYQSTDSTDSKCELYLLDILLNDARIKAYFRENRNKIQYAMSQFSHSFPDAIEEWEKGNIHTALNLAWSSGEPLEIIFKRRVASLLTLNQFSQLPTWLPKEKTSFITIPNVQNGLNYSEKELIQYIMTSNARR